MHFSQHWSLPNSIILTPQAQVHMLSYLKLRSLLIIILCLLCYNNFQWLGKSHLDWPRQTHQVRMALLMILWTNIRLSRNLWGNTIFFFHSCTVTLCLEAEWDTLIPKKNRPVSPISIFPILNMFISTLLVTRWRTVLQEIISPEQATFVGGRDIADSIFFFSTGNMVIYSI